MDERMIKSPKHYTEGRKFEPKDVIRDWGLNFNLGNAVKYLARAGRKGDAVEDLKKAQQYIQFEIDALVAEGKEQKKQEPPTHPNCKCAPYPFYMGGTLKVEIPAGVSPEDIIQMVIRKLYGEE